MPAKRSIALLAALLPAVIAAQEPQKRVKVLDEETQQGQSLPSISLLPVGSVLRKVMIPRYSRERELTSCMYADLMTLIDPDTVETRNVHLEFFNPGRVKRGFADVQLATYNQKTGILKSNDTVVIHSDRFATQGSGLYYNIRLGKGFLAGPVTTISQGLAPEPSTSMKFAPQSTAAVAAAALMATTAAPANPPERLTPGQHAELTQSAQSQAGAAREAAATTRQQVAAGQPASDQASSQAREFIKEAGVKVSEPAPAAAAPLEVKPGPKDSTIKADDGMYFDSEKGVIVFLKNVRVNDARFDLSGAQELKILLEPKAKDDKAKKDDKKDAKEKAPGMLPGGNSFGDVQRVIATGQVLVKMKGADGKDTEACAAVFDYNVKTGEIVMHGGYPWVRQGTSYARARQPDLYLRIYKNNSFVTEGQWDMGGQLDHMPKDSEKDKKDSHR